MELCKISYQNKKLKDLLLVPQTLIRLGFFCKILPADNRFGDLHSQYRIDIAKISRDREAYNSTISLSAKVQYEKTDLTLSDMFEIRSIRNF